MKPEPVVSSPAAIHLALLINMLSMGSIMYRTLSGKRINNTV